MGWEINFDSIGTLFTPSASVKMHFSAFKRHYLLEKNWTFDLNDGFELYAQSKNCRIDLGYLMHRDDMNLQGLSQGPSRKLDNVAKTTTYFFFFFLKFSAQWRTNGWGHHFPHFQSDRTAPSRFCHFLVQRACFWGTWLPDDSFVLSGLAGPEME